MKRGDLMKLKIIIPIFLLILFSFSVFASQAMPRYALNEQTKECSEFFMGDECTTCSPPEGWDIIEEFQCPEGYEEVDVNSVCGPHKSDFCCTVAHSGVNGDCDDVVVNDVEKRCAFVEDITQCGSLPTNWEQAEELDFWGKACPSLDYEWLEETLGCEPVTDNQDNIVDDDKQNSNNLWILIGVVAIIIIAGFFIIKRKK